MFELENEQRDSYVFVVGIKSAIMTKFQREKLAENDERVLLLELHNESASGANLTTANHVIFVHPLHVRNGVPA